MQIQVQHTTCDPSPSKITSGWVRSRWRVSLLFKPLLSDLKSCCSLYKCPDPQCQYRTIQLANLGNHINTQYVASPGCSYSVSTFNFRTVPKTSHISVAIPVALSLQAIVARWRDIGSLKTTMSIATSMAMETPLPWLPMRMAWMWEWHVRP